MNPEVSLTLIALVKLLIAVFIGFWYSLCGRGVIRGWLGRRRVICPLIYLVGLACTSLTSMSLKLVLTMCITYLIYLGTMSLGYGTGSILRKLGKVVQRGVIGSLVGGSCILLAYVSGNWVVFTLSVFVSCGTSIALGVFNPVHAAYEEALIGTSKFLPAMFIV